MKKLIIYPCLIMLILLSSCKKVAVVVGKDGEKEAISMVEKSASKITPKLKKALNIFPETLQQELADVLSHNPKLADFLEDNPQFVTKWAQLYKQVPSKSGDLTFVRLFIHIDEYAKFNGTKMADLIFKEGKDGEVIILGKEGEILGKIKPGPVIYIPKENLNNIFTQLKPLPNCKYILDNAEYTTDEAGRITKSTFKVNKDALSKHHSWTENTFVLNSSKAAKAAKEGDQAGHLLADEFGGSSNMLNLIPMTKGVNKSVYRKLEQEWKKLAEQGKDVKVSVKLKYSGNSPRPVWIIITYIIDGKTITKEIQNI